MAKSSRALSVGGAPAPVKVETPVFVQPLPLEIDPKGIEPVKGSGLVRLEPKRVIPAVGVAPVAAALVKVTVNMKPFGYLAVDGAARSREEAALFDLNLPPGVHTFTVTCEHCEQAGRSEDRDVQAGKPNVLWLKPPLKPSLVKFEGFPDDAMVRVVGAEDRTVAQARSRPFKIEMPAEGSSEHRHVVTYEVTHEGKVLQKDSLPVIAGESKIIEGKARQQ